MTNQNGATDYVSFVRGYVAAMNQDFYGSGTQEYTAMGQALPTNTKTSTALPADQDGRGFFAGTLDLSAEDPGAPEQQRQGAAEPAS